MTPKKELVSLLTSELMKEIVSIRIDTMWKMLKEKKEGRLPEIDSEKATGKFDDKGAIFIPGGMIFENSDKRAIEIEPYDYSSNAGFKEKIRGCMKYDNAVLLYPEGIATAINLRNGFFNEVASSIHEQKRAVMKKKVMATDTPPSDITSEQITKSYCPTNVKPPYGTRTRLSACIAACLIEPEAYFEQCKRRQFLRESERESFWKRIRSSKEPVRNKEGRIFVPPHIIVCHNTRYKEESYTGITRILLGFGRFGEFATFTLEEATGNLLKEIGGEKNEYTEEDIVARYDGLSVVAVVRLYPSTTPGKRLNKGVMTSLVSPQKDLGLDLETITKEAKERYKVRQDIES